MQGELADVLLIRGLAEPESRLACLSRCSAQLRVLAADPQVSEDDPLTRRENTFWLDDEEGGEADQAIGIHLDSKRKSKKDEWGLETGTARHLFFSSPHLSSLPEILTRLAVFEPLIWPVQTVSSRPEVTFIRISTAIR
ncbi:unnamed protein product [Protopolystoma xenopodis]|uniref:Uncharacterized protein n=1 Tax=Protopolystoma xenopodis TaxID=117903 RepID=A0A448WCG4_9PLAT|nr:unnamed protein product [Protopolystoma xenopodis]